MFRQIFAAATLALTLSAPGAEAGGSLSFSFSARTSDEARALRTGLVIYGLWYDVQTNGHVSQAGANNAAALAQNGQRHTGIIRQEGRDHVATLSQSGDRNAYGIFQFGRGVSSHVNQTGRGRTGVTIGYGW